MKVREIVFFLTGVKDEEARDAITRAWRERGKLARDSRLGYPGPEVINNSRKATLAWVLLTMAQDEPSFFTFGLLAALTLPLFGLITFLSVLLRNQ